MRSGDQHFRQDGPGQADFLLKLLLFKKMGFMMISSIQEEGMKQSMVFHLRGRCVPLFLTLLLIAAFPSYAQDVSLSKAVTLTGQSMDWHLEEPVKRYTPDDLFTYINGEAELYMPYGFTQLASAFYSKIGSKAEIGLAVDVYQMGSLLDAFGIYAQYRKPDNQFLTMGCEGYVNPSQLLFYQDRYFINLAASGTSEFDRSIFETFARAVSKNLPSSSLPRELDLVKVKSLIPRTERYYPEGLLGYRFFRHGLIALAQLENKKVRFFVLMEESPQSAQKTVTAYVHYLDSSGKKFQPLEAASGERTLFAVDPLHSGLIIGTKGRYVFGAADLDNPGQGSGLMKEIITRLP
jgi:hypothetical protein